MAKSSYTTRAQRRRARTISESERKRRAAQAEEARRAEQKRQTEAARQQKREQYQKKQARRPRPKTSAQKKREKRISESERARREEQSVQARSPKGKKIEAGRRIYQTIKQMISDAKADGMLKSAEHLERVLKEEVDTYGDIVFMCMANAEVEFISQCQVALRYRPGAPQHKRAIQSIETLIRGYKLTEEQNDELEAAFEEDAEEWEETESTPFD